LPLSSILFNYAICGSKVVDEDKVIQPVSQGATFREVVGVKLFTLAK
jgi:hypothetical protein